MNLINSIANRFTTERVLIFTWKIMEFSPNLFTKIAIYLVMALSNLNETELIEGCIKDDRSSQNALYNLFVSKMIAIGEVK